MRRLRDDGYGLRRGRIPIYDDVRYGVGGLSGGRFIMNDGETAPVYSVYGDTLLQENEYPLLQEDESPIWT